MSNIYDSFYIGDSGDADFSIAPYMRGSRRKAKQYGGEHVLLNKDWTRPFLNSLGNFAVPLDLLMSYILYSAFEPFHVGFASMVLSK